MWKIDDFSERVCDGEHQTSLEKKDGFRAWKYQYLAEKDSIHPIYLIHTSATSQTCKNAVKSGCFQKLLRRRVPKNFWDKEQMLGLSCKKISYLLTY